MCAFSREGNQPMHASLEYYREHSPITNPGPYAYLYQDLPTDLNQLVHLIQGQMLHRNAAEMFGVSLPNLGYLMLLNELFLGEWLIVKGFNPSAIASLLARTDAQSV